MRRLLILVIGLLLALPVALVWSGRITIVVGPDSAAAELGSTTGAPTPTAIVIVPTIAGPTATPLATVTRQATVAPTPTATPSPTTYRDAKAAVDIQGIEHVWQTWNNCGPATLAMYLGYYGTERTQAEIAAALRPDSSDKNVVAEELVAYARSQGYEALARANGSTDVLRLLLSNDIPVIVETWYQAGSDEGMAHFRLLTGYDDATAEWYAYDSYDAFYVRAGEEYTGIAISYADFEALWPVVNRHYVLVYPSERVATVTAILGADADEEVARQRAIAVAEAEVAADDGDAYAWFNLGSDLVAVGRYDEAAAAYRKAEAIGWPERMLWYQFGIFEAAVESGQPEWALTLVESVLEQTDDIEEVWYWQGKALAALGDAAAAQLAYEKAIALNPEYAPAAEALATLADA